MRDSVKKNPIAAAVMAWVVLVASTAIFMKIAGLDYDQLGKTTESLRNDIALPLAGVALITIAIVTRMGIWKDVWMDKVKLKGGFLLAGVATILVGILLFSVFNKNDTAALPSNYLLWLGVAVLLVGFCEEILSRGILVTLFRQAKHPEWRVGVVSSILFGLLHLTNLFLGSELKSVIPQVITTAFIGYFLYLIRRSSKGLLFPILLHAGYDFAIIFNSFYS